MQGKKYFNFPWFSFHNVNKIICKSSPTETLKIEPWSPKVDMAEIPLIVTRYSIWIWTPSYWWNTFGNITNTKLAQVLILIMFTQQVLLWSWKLSHGHKMLRRARLCPWSPYIAEVECHWWNTTGNIVDTRWEQMPVPTPKPRLITKVNYIYIYIYAPQIVSW